MKKLKSVLCPLNAVMAITLLLSTVTASLTSAAASAQTPAAALSSLEKILEMFDGGTPASFDDIKGAAFAGRCVDFFDRAKVMNGLMTYISDNPGPALGGEKLLAFIGMTDGDYKDPAFFDNGIERSDLKRAKDYLISAVKGGRMGIDTSAPTLTFWRDFEGNGKIDTSNALKKFDSYLVLRTTNLIRQDIHSGSGTKKLAEKDQVISACYFFKKIPEVPNSSPGNGPGGGGGCYAACGGSFADCYGYCQRSSDCFGSCRRQMDFASCTRYCGR